MINQISFRAPDLAILRIVLARVQADGGASDIQPTTHGNAALVYFRNPEGNRIEVFMDSRYARRSAWTSPTTPSWPGPKPLPAAAPGSSSAPNGRPAWHV